MENPGRSDLESELKNNSLILMRGREDYRISPLKSEDFINTIRKTRIDIWDPKLFTTHPGGVRDIVDHLGDQPGCGGDVGLRAAAPDSLADQRSNTELGPRPSCGGTQESRI